MLVYMRLDLKMSMLVGAVGVAGGLVAWGQRIRMQGACNTGRSVNFLPYFPIYSAVHHLHKRVSLCPVGLPCIYEYEQRYENTEPQRTSCRTE